MKHLAVNIFGHNTWHICLYLKHPSLPFYDLLTFDKVAELLPLLVTEAQGMEYAAFNEGRS